MDLVPFAAEGDAVGQLLSVLPAITAVILATAGMMWTLGWLGRYFEYLKSLDSQWIDRKTLGFVHSVLAGFWIAFLIIAILAIVQTLSTGLHDAFTAFVVRLPSVFFALFVVFLAALLVRILQRFGAYLRGELVVKPKHAAPPKALAFASVFLKYFIYFAAVGFAILGGIRLLPADDQAFVQANVGAVPSPDGTVFLILLIIVAFVALSDRFIDSMFEDVKRRGKKVALKALDDLRAITRYSIWLVGAVVVAFVLLDVVLSPELLVLAAVGLLALLVLAGVLALEPGRNALAGVTLMRTDPFTVGDLVKVGDSVEGMVMSIGLMTTQLRTPTGEQVHVPNTQIAQRPVTNHSRSRPSAICVQVTVRFDVDHTAVNDLLVQAAKDTQGILSEPPPRVYATEFDGEGILYRLIANTDEPDRRDEIKSALIFAVQDTFRASEVTPGGESLAREVATAEG